MGASHTEEHRLEARWGTRSCALCGATIILGQPYTKTHIKGRRVSLCYACATEPRSLLRSAEPGQRLARAA